MPAAVSSAWLVATSSAWLAAGAVVNRSLLREFLSRSYNWLLARLLSVGFLDAQCGFKAFRCSIAKELSLNAYDNNWFFDTEMLFLAEKQGGKIKEIPVRWQEDRDSRVALIKTIKEDLRGIRRLKNDHRS